MKKAILYVLVASSLLTGCKNNIKNEDPEAKEIKLRATLMGIRANGAVDAINQMSSIGIFAAKEGEWDPASVLIGNDASTLTAGGTISFSHPYYYPLDEAFVDFYTYHPHTPIGSSGANYVAAPSAGNPPILHFTITGQEDVMFSYHQYGSTTTEPDPFTYLHQLTQLKFVAERMLDYPTGITITSITVTGVNTTSTLNISNGDIGTWGTPGNITVPIINGGAISTTPTGVGAAVMLEPDKSSFSITVVTSLGTYSGIVVTPNGDSEFEDGKAYTVTLTFGAYGVSLVATITPWDTGTGSGSILIE